MGFLSWGGKNFYLKNTNDSICLNSNSNGFVLNENKEVMEFDPSNFEKSFGKTLDNYYPHPYHVDKKIKSFEIIRIIPFDNTITSIVEVNNDGILLYNDNESTFFSISKCLKYPEFFKPLYE